MLSKTAHVYPPDPNTLVQIGMELRVLLPIAYGHTFYGDWEYKFGRAGYGGHVEDWEAAVQALARMPLDTLTQIHRHNFAVCSIIDRYQAVCRLWVCFGWIFVWLLPCTFYGTRVVFVSNRQHQEDPSQHTRVRSMT